MSNRPDPEPMVARDATYYRAPDALRARVRASLARQSRQDDRSRPWPFLAMAASFAAAAIITWNVALMTAGPSSEDLFARDVVTAHVRSLMIEGHLNDVASSDQHTVKPWFAGKLDFAPPVRDLANTGYPLAGGRLDYVNGRAVAALTYRYRAHVVNVFEWPEAGESAPRAKSLQGYSVVRWTHAGMGYAAVSDAAAAPLVALADALRTEEAN